MRSIKNKFKLHRILPLVIICLISVMVLSPQLMNHGTIIGEDCWFHMNRAYEAMMQIKTGHFSYFLDLFSFNRSGRIVTGIYGPLGSYFEGLLLLIVKTWYRWEITNSLIVLVISSLSVYYVAKRLGSSFFTSLVAGTFYMISFPFDRWVLNQNFDGFGAMLLPWVLLSGYQIYKHNFSSVKLALLMTLIIQVHVMSAFVAINSLLLSFVLANLKPGRFQLWKKTAESAGLCLLLTINFWGSLLEVKTSNKLVPTWPYHSFMSPSNVINIHMIKVPIKYQLVVELMILLLFGLILLVFRNFNPVTAFLAVQSLYFIWITSKYFPWVNLLRHHAMISSYIQFPERFLPLAIASIILLITQLRPRWLMLIVLLIPVLININTNMKNEQSRVNDFYQNTVLSQHNVMLSHRDSSQKVNQLLNSYKVGAFIKASNNMVPDYMPFYTDINQPKQYYRLQPNRQNQKQIINNRLSVRHAIVRRNIAKLTFNIHSRHQIQIPFVKYAHTKLWLNHRLIKPRLTQIQAIKIQPSQYHNVLEAQYQPSQWYKDLIIIELLSWLLLIVGVIIYRIRRF